MNFRSNPHKPAYQRAVSISHDWRGLLSLAIILAISSWTTILSAQVSFDTAVNYSVGQRPDGITTGDFDNDGDNDLAVVTSGAAGNLELVEIFLNNADGTFVAGPMVFLPNSSSPNEIISADLDGDSDIDLAVILRDLQQIQIVTNLGTGTFALGTTAAVGDRARGMTMGDYDGDLDIDLAVANRDDNTATVLTNNGLGVFSSSTLTIGGETRAASFINIDGDADLDLAVTDNDNRNVTLFTNTGTGFSAAGTISTGPVYRPEGIVSSDLNGDGLPDMAVALNDDVQPDAVAVFLNAGGTFGAATQFFTNGVNTSGILATDLDCDGIVDLATRNEDSNDVSLLPNLGGGSFGTPITIPTGLNPSQMVAGDFDGDGDVDLGVSNRDSNTFSVLINSCGGGVTTVMPESFLVTRGTYISGGTLELGESDNADFSLQRATSDVQSRTEFEVLGFSPTASPTSMQVTLETSVFARSTVVQSIELFDYVGGSWEVVDSRNATNMVDSTTTVSAAGDLSRFVNQTTLSMEARIRFQSISPRQRFASNTDQFIWTIE